MHSGNFCILPKRHHFFALSWSALKKPKYGNKSSKNEKGNKIFWAKLSNSGDSAYNYYVVIYYILLSIVKETLYVLPGF